MNVNESAENYLETILILSHRLPVVRSVDIANELGFKKSSVSIAMKNLREKKHIVVSDSGFITLTESGKAIADEIQINVVARKNVALLTGAHGLEREALPFARPKADKIKLHVSAPF